jgi:ABC-2 type transport system permease protein
MQIAHVFRALKALTMREITKFAQQRGRLLSALVRPLMWLAVFAAGFYNVFGVSIIPPYKTYITYQVYIVPGLLGIILLFHGMQSSLSMVYDREMGVMRLLLTAPLPRWVLLVCKLIAGTALSVITCYVFLAVCISALYPLWKLREGGSEALYYVALANPFTHAVELIRFALYGDFEMVAAAVVSASTVVFFLLAVFGYNPQRGMSRRAPQPA